MPSSAQAIAASSALCSLCAADEEPRHAGHATSPLRGRDELRVVGEAQVLAQKEHPVARRELDRRRLRLRIVRSLFAGSRPRGSGRRGAEVDL
jgi:hypothetical protein